VFIEEEALIARLIHQQVVEAVDWDYIKTQTEAAQNQSSDPLSRPHLTLSVWGDMQVDVGRLEF
jgi:hypothetical protein